MKNNSTDSSSDPDQPADHVWLDQALRESGEHYVSDDGFTQNVIGALPASRRRAWRRSLLIALAAASGTLLTLVLGGHEIALTWARSLQWLDQWNAGSVVSGPFIVLTGGILLLCGAISWAAWRKATR